MAGAWAKDRLIEIDSINPATGAAWMRPPNSGFVTAGEQLEVDKLVECVEEMGKMAERATTIPYHCVRCKCMTQCVDSCPDKQCPIFPPKPPSAFHAILDEIRAIHDAKNKDYADSEDKFKNFRECEKWGLPAEYGCFTRMGDKVARLNNLIRREFLDGDGAAVSSESVEDTAIDLAVYSLIYVLLRRERVAKGAK